MWTFEKSWAGPPFSIHLVRNGVEAIEFLRNARGPDALPRIILLDLKMPVLNGFEVLTWMQQQTFEREIPVVVVSGSAQEEDKVRACQLGAADYFVKPVTAEHLKRILQHVSSDAKQQTLAEPGARL